MKTYRPAINANDVESIRREFQSIEEAAYRAEEYLELQELHAQPARLRTGLIVLADGVDWNPGAGAGVYAYYGGVWNRLG